METKTSRSQQLELRMLDFSISVITATKTVPKTTENFIIAKQLIGSATAIGANYTEANNAASKLDFRNKIFVAKKEAAETRYWLQLLVRANPAINLSYLNRRRNRTSFDTAKNCHHPEKWQMINQCQM